MNGPGHRAVGAATWLATAPHLGVTWWQVAAGTVVAGACAHGRLSPDMDQAPVLRALIPGGHRAWTHWWPVVAAGAVAAHQCPASWAWVAWAVTVAWGSHIGADGVFGRIPIWPSRGRWHRAGIGLVTGGRVERALTPFIAATGIALAVVDIHGALT